MGTRLGELKTHSDEPTLAQVWLEGHVVRKSLKEWCEDHEVPGPSNEAEEHREKNVTRTTEFGLVNKPIPANSETWKSKAGQDAMQEERAKHEKRGTWNLKGVIEVNDLMKQTRETGEEVILGGVHPVMYQKNSENPEQASLRVRFVFTAPRAKTSSGLDPHTIY